MNKKMVCMAVGTVTGAAVCSIIKRIRNICDENEKLKRKNYDLEDQARTDELTGLGNRYSLREDFKSFQNKKVMVALIDVDHFKEFNDTHGHNMGDKALKEVASELNIVFWRDYCYRYGGDEFLAIVDLDDSSYDVEWYSDDLSIFMKYIKVEGIDISVDASFGIATGTVGMEADLRNLIDEADKKMYEMKETKKQEEEDDWK